MNKPDSHGSPLSMPHILPMSRAEMDRLGWDELDILLISGDAYIDHPSFGAALLGRWLVRHGFRVGIIAQPRWTTTDDITRMGRPRLFAGITAGALDSMLAHYTAFRKKRSDDAYTPGGQAGARPNRACLVYSTLVKQAFPKLPIILGGIEASLRRITHYDFWTDKLRRPILLDAKADLLLYGMAERAILAAAMRLRDGLPLADPSLPNAVYIGDPATIPGWQAREGEAHFRKDEAYPREGEAPAEPSPAGARPAIGSPEGSPSPTPPMQPIIPFPSHESILADPKVLMAATLAMEEQVHHSAFAYQPIEGRTLIITPPQPLSTAELDELYALPFTRDPHPAYDQPIPAAEMIRFSINSHRGCAGGCSFCALASHQGRTIASRSADSIVQEAETLTRHPRFTGSISDVGGPSANMFEGFCGDDPGRCRRASCLFPAVCPHFVVDQMRIVQLLQRVRQVKGVKHVRVASGIRYDLALKDRQYIRALVREYVGGQLKIAPEHLSDEVLRLMRKPGRKAFEQFLDIFEQECRAAGKEQYIIPYLISAFPGCTEAHMQQLAQWLSKRGWRPQQVQCFIPLPGTTAAAMYYAGIDPAGKPIPVARTDARRLQMHYTLMRTPGTGSRPGPVRRRQPPRR